MFGGKPKTCTMARASVLSLRKMVHRWSMTAMVLPGVIGYH